MLPPKGNLLVIVICFYRFIASPEVSTETSSSRSSVTAYMKAVDDRLQDSSTLSPSRYHLLSSTDLSIPRREYEEAVYNSNK